MNKKHLFSLVVLAVLALVLGISLSSNQKGQSEFHTETLISNTDWSSLVGLSISTPSTEGEPEQVVRLEQRLERWKVVTNDDYPPNMAKLSELIQALKNAQIIELKTKLAKNYHRLGLDMQQGNARLLTIDFPDKSIELVVGDAAKNGGGQYARLTTNEQTYLLDQTFDISTQSSDWIKPQVFDFDYQQVTKINIDFIQGDDFVIHRPKNEEGELAQEFELEESLDGKTLTYATVFSGLVRNVLGLSATDANLSSAEAPLKRVASYDIDFVSDDKEISEQFSLYKTITDSDDEAITYYVQKSDENYLLTVSEFDAKQIAKPLNDYFEQE